MADFVPGTVEFNAPNFIVRVADAEIPVGIRSLVQSIEYESAESMADVLKMVVADPDTTMLGGGIQRQLRDTKIFQPGNEIDVKMGYGAELRHIGRAIIRKLRPQYPSTGMPTIEVIGYTADSIMMDNAPRDPDEGAGRPSPRKNRKGGRRFKNMRWSDAVSEIGEFYNFELDVDDTKDAPHDFIQKVGQSDYDFVQGIANLNGYLFWVDGDAEGTWHYHFRNPETLQASDVQEKKYTFRYSQGNQSSLLAFEPELAIQNAIVDLRLQMKDVRTGRLVEVKFQEPNEPFDSLVVAGGETLSVADQALQGPHTSASAIKIFMDDYSFEERTSRRFANEAELIAWGRQWFRRNRENFVMSRGVTIGLETLLCHQTHAIVGLGTALDGDYYFSRVRHIMSGKDYKCDFNVRKVVTPIEG